MLFLISCLLAAIACARGWFPWAILLLSAPWLLPYAQEVFMTTGFDPLELLGEAHVALPLNLLTLFGLAGMSVMGRD
jgi:hypothetical protein